MMQKATPKRCVCGNGKADLIFDDCNTFAMGFGQNVVQQSCLSRSKEAGDNLHRSTSVSILRHQQQGQPVGAHSETRRGPTVTGTRVSTTSPWMSMISGSAAVVAGAGAGVGLAAFFLVLRFVCAELCLPDFAFAWAWTLTVVLATCRRRYEMLPSILPRCFPALQVPVSR